MKPEVVIYTLHESGVTFMDIAKRLGMSAAECAALWVKADIAKDKFKSREKVVYRKRLINKVKK